MQVSSISDISYPLFPHRQCDSHTLATQGKCVWPHIHVFGHTGHPGICQELEKDYHNIPYLDLCGPADDGRKQMARSLRLDVALSPYEIL